MREYSTQMEAARKGIVTKELEIVAKKERMTVEELMPLVAEGKVAICANKNHKCIDPEGVGSMLKTKINVNLGISRDCKDYDIEMEKVMQAVNMGAHAIMDLSSHGNTIPFRRKLTSECPAMIGTVPVYDSVIHYQRDLDTLTAQDFIDVVRLHAQDGVDFVTLHCGITRKTIEQIKKHKRKMNIVSRGGSLVFAWMCMTGNENPFYEYYDEILDICREYDVTISLGDACRPGCLADASDVCQIEELVRLGELTKRAWAKDVQVMVEGPGHMPMDQIEANMKIQQTICCGAPFYVLGPLVTDIFPGYDHITSAIGGAIAAANGAETLIMGAFGCGRNGYPVEQVIELIQNWIAEHPGAVPNVVFAVPRMHADAFREAFGAPEPERPAPVVVAEGENDREGDDEDWRNVELPEGVTLR